MVYFECKCGATGIVPFNSAGYGIWVCPRCNQGYVSEPIVYQTNRSFTNTFTKNENSIPVVLWKI